MMRTTTHHPPNAKRGVSSRRPTCCGETRPLTSRAAAHARRGLRSAQFDEASQEVGVDVKHRLPNSEIFQIAVNASLAFPASRRNRPCGLPRLW